MAPRVQQWIATAVVGAALSTSVVAIAPQLLAAEAVPVVEVTPVKVEPMPVDEALTADGAVDMNHWRESADPVTPYTTGKDRKSK